jgi:hypothetical protein
MENQRLQIYVVGNRPCPTSNGLGTAMPFKMKGSARYKTRREAERALAEILEDGGQLADFRIDENPDGSCVILILERDGEIAGTLGV